MAQLGDILCVLVDPALNNGSDEAAAIVTLAREDGLVNLTIFQDESATTWVNAVRLYDKRPDEETLAEDHPDTPGPGYQRAAWPLAG
jgi:hypothetical protein